MDCDLPESMRKRPDAGWRAYKRGYIERDGRRVNVRACACALARNGEWLPDPTCRRCRGYGIVRLE